MLAVWARRQGLLLSVWAKPTLYLSFFLRVGNPAAKARSPKPAAAAVPAARDSNDRRVMIMVSLPWFPHATPRPRVKRRLSSGGAPL